MKVLVIGKTNSGKDTFSEFLADNHHAVYVNTMYEAVRRIIHEQLGDKLGYGTVKETYKNRNKHKKDYIDVLRWYNQDNPTRFVEEILKISDIYSGLYDSDTLKACKEKDLFDIIIGIYSEEDVDDGCLDIDIFKECDLIINNTQSIDHLWYKAYMINL